MTKKTRTISFLICLFLFLLIVPVAVLYSQGYRIDFNPPAGGKMLTQTGGLFLKAGPKQAEIYLNGKLVKKTDFFFGSALIENLLPKRYKIEIKKPTVPTQTGFFPWEKTLEIKEKEVTEAKSIILFPENLNFNILATGVKSFWFSPDGKKITLKEENEKQWALKLYDLEKNIKSHLIGEEDVSSKGAELINLEFSENLKEISLEVGVSEQLKYFSLALDKTSPILIEIKTPATSSLENFIASKKFNNDTYYLDESGYLFKNEEQITEKIFPIKQETEYGLEVFPNFIFLREGEILYQLNPDLKSFEKFFEGIQDLKISPDSKKIVLLSDYEIWILFLKDEMIQPQRKAGEKVFLMRLSEKIKNCFWLNSDYLVFNVGNKIKISEIDNRDKINVIEIKPPTNNSGGVEIFWNKIDKKLYLLSEGGFLYSSGVLLPS